VGILGQFIAFNKEGNEFMYKQRRKKDQIIAHCKQCDGERVIAYWDYELESYIYLCDTREAYFCLECLALETDSEQVSKRLELSL
jgi:hypothetical protein